MKNFIKRSILFVIIVLLLGAFGVLGYYAFVDIRAEVAKDYLIERYGFDKKDLFVTKSTEYVYEDITNCETLWFKKCSDDEKLHYEHTFKLKDGTIIKVKEDIDRNFTDDYNGKVVNETQDTNNNQENKTKEEN